MSHMPVSAALGRPGRLAVKGVLRVPEVTVYLLGDQGALDGDG